MKKKGIISAVNGWKRALLTKSAFDWINKRCTAQSTLCVGNKKGKTEFFFFLVKRAGRHFGFFKRAGRHEKGAGRRALQKKPRQNTDDDRTHCCRCGDRPSALLATRDSNQEEQR